MSGPLAIVAFIGLSLGSVIWAVVTDMSKDEVRTRLTRLPYLLIRVASVWIPKVARHDFANEWNAELEFVVYGTEGMPLTRLFRGIIFSAGLVLHGAPAVAHEIAGSGASNETPDLTPARIIGGTWSNLFPEGRDIFYEGDDPTGFVSQIKAEFGFSPAVDSGWGVKIHADDYCFTSYSFRCPSEHLDAIYGSDRFAMGS
jgi:hypothetical protein